MTSSWGTQRTGEHRASASADSLSEERSRNKPWGSQAKGLGPLGAEDPAGISGHIT